METWFRRSLQRFCHSRIHVVSNPHIFSSHIIFGHPPLICIDWPASFKRELGHDSTVVLCQMIYYTTVIVWRYLNKLFSTEVWFKHVYFTTIGSQLYNYHPFLWGFGGRKHLCGGLLCGGSLLGLCFEMAAVKFDLVERDFLLIFFNLLWNSFFILNTLQCHVPQT